MIKIIDYAAGNAPSVLNAIEHMGYKASLCRTPSDLEDATHIILPGVGSARATIDSLLEMNILSELEKAVLVDKVPFLGICVGLQILFDFSEEENTVCLGWLKGRVVKFDQNLTRVPQMGWNKVTFQKNIPYSLKSNYFYFVNSYHALPEDESVVWGVSHYGVPFTAAINKENIYATQFHVEKSGAAGLSLLEYFIHLTKE